MDEVVEGLKYQENIDEKRYLIKMKDIGYLIKII